MSAPLFEIAVSAAGRGRIEIRASYPAQVLMQALVRLAERGLKVLLISSWAVVESEDGSREAMFVLAGPLLLVILSTDDNKVSPCYRVYITKKKDIEKAVELLVYLAERHLKGEDEQ